MLETDTDHHLKTPHTNPLRIVSVLKLSLLIGSMLILVALGQHYAGTIGMELVVFLGGLVELHSVTLATAMLFLDGKFPLENADKTLALAILASFVTKYILLFALARNRFGLVTAGFLTLMLLAGGITFYLVY